MQRFENWMSYSFDGVEYGTKTKDTKNFTINFNKKFKPIPSLKEALYKNGSLMRDMYTEPFDVCLSGGTDSEIVVRTFKDLKIKHNTFIFRCENNLNYRDIAQAIELCNELNIDYKIIDFNMQKFFENDAYDLLNETLMTSILHLPRLKWFEYLDNIPVMGDGDPYWHRELESDFSKKSRWYYPLNESTLPVTISARRFNRIAIPDWYEYTPYTVLASVRHPVFKALINDEVPGKISTWSSRHLLYKDVWPDLKNKPKLTGYESYGSNTTIPTYIEDFVKHIGAKDVVLDEQDIHYTISELEELLIDND
jgi:hypothetical protein